MRLPTQMPEGRPGQALSLTILLGILLAVIFGCVQPALRWYVVRQDVLAADREQVAQILAQQKLLPQLRQQARASQALGQWEVLLAGNSDEIAEANMQSAVTLLASRAGASLSSTAVLPAEMSGALRRVGLEVYVTSDWQAFTDLLTSIQNARPRLIVDDLSVNSSIMPGSGDKLLQASFAVFGFRSGTQ